MSIKNFRRRLGDTTNLTEDLASRIVAAATPHALAALAGIPHPPVSLAVTAEEVDPASARGGSLVPAWPVRAEDGSVIIEFVEDWGALLAGWRSVLQEPASESDQMDALVASGERVWVGVANDVMQLFVPDPPEGSYSMVRHHGLMLAAATLWLGPSRSEQWRHAHDLAAIAFLRALPRGGLWNAVEEAERGLQHLLADSRSSLDAEGTILWLDTDPAAAAVYQAYLQAASLGIASLLEAAPREQWSSWLQHTVSEEHAHADFNVALIEQYARRPALA